MILFDSWEASHVAVLKAVGASGVWNPLCPEDGPVRYDFGCLTYRPMLDIGC